MPNTSFEEPGAAGLFNPNSRSARPAASSRRLDETQDTRLVMAMIAALIGVRLVVAAFAPLAFDEALYWRWSLHLSTGYLDHPPVTPLLIRGGTALFGDTPFGVRVLFVLLAIPATWCIWRAAATLFASESVGRTAALYFNLTLATAVGSILATPDFPVVTMSAVLLLCLAKLHASGRGEWWLAAGAAFGLGMVSKYSMLFFAPSILIWLLIVPAERRWLLTLWPWLGGLVALAVFSPVLFWNAEHGWASIFYQSGRLVVHGLYWKYLAEYPATQFGLATPPIFVLGCLGVVRSMRRGVDASRVLIAALIVPIAAYFLWHTFHGRVEGNWPMPLYPAFAVAAALCARVDDWRGVARILVRWSRSLAVPVGISFAAVICLQAVFGLLPLGNADPTARSLGAGWPKVAARIDALRSRIGAPVVLASDYGLTSWLSFYLPSHPPVLQVNGRMRWVNDPQPDPRLFAGPILFVCWAGCDAAGLAKRFAIVEFLGAIERMRHGVGIATYNVYRVASPIGAPLDPFELMSK